MGFLKRLFRLDAKPPASEAEDHAVIIRLSLSDNRHGTADERVAIHVLTDELDRVIREAGVGEYDGDEFGDGNCSLYLYGPDADALRGAVMPALRAFPGSAGATITRRYGPANDQQAREETQVL